MIATTIFRSDSYWNVPAPDLVDAESGRFITWLKANNRNPYLALGVGDWAMPVYRSTSTDPLVTINPSGPGPTVTFRLPKDARPMAGNDAAMSVIDVTTNQDIALFEFRRDSRGKPQATGVSRYWLDSEGLDQRVGGSSGNTGHRGVPGLTMCVRREDLARGLGHRTKIALPGTGGWGCFPMSGFEKGKGGIIGEGIILRIKASVDLATRPLSAPALAIAHGLQTHGAVVGDNGAQVTLKVEAGTTLPRDALRGLTWDDFEFVERGWRP